MSKQAQHFFLEDWLKSSTTTTPIATTKPTASSARAIIQSWSNLRNSLQTQTFQLLHLQSLQTLLNSQTSINVADPQAKLLLSILSSSSPNLSLPPESHPLFLKLLYIWVRKSSKPSQALLDSALPILSNLFNEEREIHFSVGSLGVLLLGAISFVPGLSENSRKACVELLCKLFEQERGGVMAVVQGEFVPEVLAGIGYALISSEIPYISRILDCMFGIWGKGKGLSGSVSYGLMMLHLIEWVVSGFINLQSYKKIECLCGEISRTRKLDSALFAVVMVAAGGLRGLIKAPLIGTRAETVHNIRISLEKCIAVVARELISKTGSFCHSAFDPNIRLIVQCIALSLARSGPVSFDPSLLLCITFASLTEVFPLRSFYSRILDSLHKNSIQLGLSEVKAHLDSILFKEAGAITRVFCDQYVSADDEHKTMVEKLIWSYCQDLYSEHRRIALALHGELPELFGDLEKIAESSFLMVVVFASVVTKNRFNSALSREIQLDVSVGILVSFSRVEYFRRIRLPEYTDAIRGVAKNVQENEPACVSFVESMPSYDDLTNCYGSVGLSEVEYNWAKDNVQTARILFYLRVIPTCIERVPASVFSKVVAPTMFLYMGHPNGKLARASHSVFVSFMSSGKDSNQEERTLLKEQLVFYYIQRAIEGYPGITPFDGMASGVAALVRFLPAGSPAAMYCVHSLADKAKSLCSKAMTEDAEMWKDWQGDSEPSKKLLELLLRLLSLVDIQILPNLMKLLAQFIVELPKDGQNMVLDEIYNQVADSDDVTRKPALVSWLQSLSFLCSQTTFTKSTSSSSTDILSLNTVSARL
ncbi:uncharacterized protein LOC113275040 [Papaver somniferum]|uniref:uncharacterized protein LOC113275040 n=1 Tax=Papaver somniferum TaxID=3469 RepID=UPI000E6FF4C7|nr:uncharacterized protein LOC113275040 [Papaver somniferum]